MRTVTFSNAEAAKSINDLLLPTWKNRRPGFHDCKLGTERGIFNGAYDCYATKNFCTFFTTPDLEVLHYCSGYYSPRIFLREVEFVRELASAVLDDRNRFKKGSVEKYRQLHELQRQKRSEERKKVASMTPPKGGVVSEFTSRRDYLAQGLGHLAQVHRDLGERAIRNGQPVHLEAVLRDYLSGNEFSEEDVRRR